MPSTYSPVTKVELMATGEKSGTWGQITDNNLVLIDQAIGGYGSYVMPLDADASILVSDGLLSTGRCPTLAISSSVPLTAARNILLSPIARQYVLLNNTVQDLYFRASPGGSYIVVGPGHRRFVVTDGVNMVDAISEMGSGLKLGGALTMTGIISPAAFTDWMYDFNPAGFDTASIIFLQNTNPATGLVSMVNRPNKVITLMNVGGVPIQLYDEHPSMAAGNRFYFGFPGMLQTINSQESVTVLCTDRWRMLSRSLTQIDGGVF